MIAHSDEIVDRLAIAPRAIDTRRRVIHERIDRHPDTPVEACGPRVADRGSAGDRKCRQLIALARAHPVEPFPHAPRTPRLPIEWTSLGLGHARASERPQSRSRQQLTIGWPLPLWPSGAPSRLECRLRVGVLRHALTTCRYSDKAALEAVPGGVEPSAGIPSTWRLRINTKIRSADGGAISASKSHASLEAVQGQRRSRRRGRATSPRSNSLPKSAIILVRRTSRTRWRLRDFDVVGCRHRR